jgi:3-oxoacyl-[acyl-carrier-protein] synthase III
MGAIINKIASYLPEKVLSNRDLEAAFKDWSADKIEAKTGIRERHVVDADQTALDLALEAGKKVLEGYDLEKIDFLMLCTQSPDYFLPTSACLLQDRLGLHNKVGALDFNLGCSGYVYGLALAKGLIAAGIGRAILLVTSETYTKSIHPKDKGNRTIFGDAAAATIIERSDDEHIGEFVLGTDGRGAQNLIIPNGGFRKPYDPAAPEVVDESGNVRTDNHIFMNGPEILNFTIEAVPQLVRDVLEVNRKDLESISFVIFHQANKFMLDYLRKKIKVPEAKFYSNMLTVGNTVSSTIPIALQDSLEKGLVKQGDDVLLVGFGVGYSWAGCIVRM